MSGVKNKASGKQWYRLITAMFLHLGMFLRCIPVFGVTSVCEIPSLEGGERFEPMI